MPDTPIKLSDMTEALALSIADLFYTGVADAQSDTGYYSRRISAQAVATSMLNSFSLPLIFTKTTAKTAAGAINELAPTVLTGTLAAGATSITLSDVAITTTSKFRFLSDTWGLYPSSEPVVATGSITLAFEAQESDCEIMVEVRN